MNDFSQIYQNECASRIACASAFVICSTRQWYISLHSVGGPVSRFGKSSARNHLFVKYAFDFTFVIYLAVSIKWLLWSFSCCGGYYEILPERTRVLWFADILRIFTLSCELCFSRSLYWAHGKRGLISFFFHVFSVNDAMSLSIVSARTRTFKSTILDWALP